MSNMVLVDELTLNVLDSVAKPLTSLHSFKNDILSVLEKHFPTSDCMFASYTETNDKRDRFIMSDVVSRGLPELYSSNRWQEDYFDTYVFNPNRCDAISDADQNVFRISDIMTKEEYEQCRNYKEVMRPNGYYYPMVTFLKYDDSYIGQISMLKKKKDGDYDEDDVKRLMDISPRIISRLLDYGENSGKMILQGLFFEAFNQSVNGMLVLDENFRFIAGNDLGEEYCADMFSDRSGESYFRQAANLVRKYYRMNMLTFQYRSKKGNREYYITVEPHRVMKSGNDFDCYLVYMNTCKLPTVSNKLESNSDFSKLSPRQREIVTLLAAGLSNKQIAEELVISTNTVRKHVENIRTLLGAKNQISVLKKLNLI